METLHEDEVKFVTGFYGDDFNIGHLKLHLEVLQANYPCDDSKESSLTAVLTY